MFQCRIEKWTTAKSQFLHNSAAAAAIIWCWLISYQMTLFRSIIWCQHETDSSIKLSTFFSCFEAKFFNRLLKQARRERRKIFKRMKYLENHSFCLKNFSWKLPLKSKIPNVKFEFAVPNTDIENLTLSTPGCFLKGKGLN